MSNITIMAHRGASCDAPENTKAAFLKAMQYSIDGIETDLQLTADGEIVIHHNYFIDDTSDGVGAIALKSLEELKQYDFGAYKDLKFSGEKILTLEELLDLVKDMRVINLELKSQVNKEYDFTGKIIDIVKHSNASDNVIFSSFDANLLKEIKKAANHFPVGLLTLPEMHHTMLREMETTFLAKHPRTDYHDYLWEVGLNKSLEEQIEELDFQPDFLHPEYHSILCNPNLVMKMHEKNIGVNPYTCDHGDEMKQLINTGCDSLITNRIDIALEVVNDICTRR